MKLIIISNRLPVKVIKKGNELTMVRSEGGLATGLGSLEMSDSKHWIGWPGMYVEDEKIKNQITGDLEKLDFHPVFLSPEQIEGFYEGYSNGTLWPLCHYFFAYIQYENQYWQMYKEVNALFCEAALPFIEPGDIVWVQDYQLMLLPAMLRERIPDASIGYFHHIPFPSYELFRVLPERAEILNGLLGADLVAFHTHDYMRHFISAVYRVLGLEYRLDEIQLSNRVVYADTFPMGINYDAYHDAVLNPHISQKAAALKKNFGNKKLMLSVDRLDYSKGILMRLKGFSEFLNNHPEYREKVSLTMIVVPSRDSVDIYADLKTEIDKAIGSINGRFSSSNWTPVYYFYRSFSFEELIASYHIADIALVTPLRDGMNLVAKEYVAAKRDTPGVLILSEMAGACIELSDAIIVNPNDTKEIEYAILKALEMPENEQLEALHKMQKIISRQTVSRWAADFVEELIHIKRRNEWLTGKLIEKENFGNIKDSYNLADRRLIIFDYDGTLAPYKKNPMKASPSPELLDLLQRLADDPKNKVVISSGRDAKTLESWLGHLSIGLAAEHGAFYKEDAIWHGNINKILWDDEIIRIIEQIIHRTPGSEMEIKKTAVVWHYRNVDAWLAELRERQLISALITPCSRLNLQIMRGYKVIEIKSSDYSKGTEAQRLMMRDNYDFILSIGDDITDEDMFRALPPHAVTIKVGDFSDAAQYNILTQSEVIPFLSQLIS